MTGCSLLYKAWTLFIQSRTHFEYPAAEVKSLIRSSFTEVTMVALVPSLVDNASIVYFQVKSPIVRSQT
jgi:hypothetical protein